MSEEMVSKESALQNVLIMAERLAFLHYAFAKTLKRELSPELAESLICKAIDEYGKLTADAVMERISPQGLDHTLINFKQGKDLPSMGWESSPVEMPEDKPHGKISKITFCPLAKIWEKLGEEGRCLGRSYCWIDQAKYKHYGKGYKCFHDKNVLDGDDCCIIRVALDEPEDERNV